MKGKKPFLYPFNLKVRILIRTGVNIRKLDSPRILKELTFIAETCKQRKMNTGDYLQIVAAYVNDVKEGNHSMMYLDPDTLIMKKNFNECEFL